MFKEFQDRQTWLKKTASILDTLLDRLEDVGNDPRGAGDFNAWRGEIIDHLWGLTEQAAVYDDPIFREDCSRADLKRKAKERRKDLQREYEKITKELEDSYEYWDGNTLCYSGPEGGGYKQNRLEDRIWEYDNIIIPALSLKAKKVVTELRS